MHVNSGKYLRILLRALGFKLDGDVFDRLAALLKDMNHIVSRTASQSDQHQLHGTWSRTAPLRPESRSKHDLVPAPGLADKNMRRLKASPISTRCLRPVRGSSSAIRRSEVGLVATRASSPSVRLIGAMARRSVLRTRRCKNPRSPCTTMRRPACACGEVLVVAALVEA